MASPTSMATSTAAVESVENSATLPVWRLGVLRVGYLVMGAGLAVKKWPLLLNHDQWELREGTVLCMLVALSVLALLGLRHPTRMLPILLFEVAWKLIWLVVVALPHWLAGNLDTATTDQAAAVAWVVIIIAVVPWGYVVRHYISARGEPWRRRR
ncbi:hypothetical protein [Microlunatus ginsengisoli]|uniref:Uncharacterized protein n=1 Tax=Microlunatus ginsengisoli TaxID=363863 RepID=A0ABP6ZAI4_9ACTN